MVQAWVINLMASQEVCNELASKSPVAQGYSPNHLVYKAPENPYSFKRSIAWLIRSRSGLPVLTAKP